MNIESEIREAIDALRDTTANTQELYREACALLFFRYGITPTANKLYHFVRKGSMSAPAEALARFWEELREKSRVRIEHPDLPDTLKAAAGELVGRLWGEAQAAAHENLNAFREEADARVTAADAATLSAEREWQVAKQQVERLHEVLDDSSERILSLERVLAAERAEKEALAGQLSAARRQHQALEAELSAARKDFASELEKQRDAMRRAEDRHEAAEKRALLEIDRERTTTAKAQKELAQIRQSNADLAQRQRDELRALEQELGDVRQRLGAAEGSLIKMREGAEQHLAQMNVMREQLSQRTTEAALLQRELELRDEKIKTMAQQMRPAREPSDASPSRPKPKPRRQKSFSSDAVAGAVTTTPPPKAR
ncbi:DNA-binding protein [Aromatoleum evansii]|uniref:DNA-binding protein n=1 Tax=Aromatoleum evansii TaxID=59406 RepID=UPI00145D6719|nr:DNA-binding protein [Aromatoleum evansii]NMG28343.1 ATPase [Aromatoleum evansii]